MASSTISGSIIGHKRRSSNSAAAGGAVPSVSESAAKKSQKHFEQLRRYILGRNPQLEEIQNLIQRDPNCVQQSDAHHGLLPLHWACVFQNPLAIVQCLLEAYPNAIDAIDSDGRTPLHHACRPEGRVELVQYLLEHGSSARRVVTMRDHRGKTPLHCACAEFVPAEMVRLLLQANPSAVKIRTRDGHTPLHCACEFNAPLETVQLLVDAYPEAVKYIRDDVNEGNYGQAKDYLAYKVQQAEQKAAEQQQARSGGGRKTPSTTNINLLARYEDDTRDRTQNNTTSESDHMRRRLEEEERKIEAEEKELNRIAQQQQQLALQRLQEQELDVEQQAAELDRLIQQKEANLAAAENNRFKKETERLFGGVNRQQANLLNDSGIVRNRSFGTTDSTPAPIFQKHRDRDKNNNNNKNINNTSNPPVSSAKQPKPEQYMTPSILSSRGVSAEIEDDELFGALRNSTQPLYPESKVSSNWIDGSHSRKGRDPSVASQYDHDANDESIPSHDDVELDEPEYTSSHHGNAIHSAPSPNPLQEQLHQALQLLEDAEQRRKKEIEEAHEQQTALQNELGKLMEKLEDSEHKRKKQEEEEQKRKQQEQEEEERRRKEEEEEEERRRKQREEEEEERRRKQQEEEEQRRKQQAEEEEQRRRRQQQEEERRQRETNPPAPQPLRGMSVGTTTSVTAESTDPSSLRKKPPVSAGTFVLKNHQEDNTNLKDGNGRTPLHVACAHGASYTSLQFLLQQFPLAIYHTDDDGNTPLHNACACPTTPLEVLQLLLDIFPAACWMANRHGQLPLHHACQHHGQRVEVLQLLMETARGVEAAAAEGDGDEEGSSVLLGGGGGGGGPSPLR